MTRVRFYCSTCARKLKRGAYLRCPLGCGARVCRGTGCAKQHGPNCLVRQSRTPTTRSPQEAA
ncbi:hypothetical protein GCM10010256_53440 [Streptomyces coeruleorubidus]|nr:hypothetical protein GCM10010256_53440 [Streptomyces coeruleorubidus]